MDVTDVTAWTWPLGLAGLAGALALHLSLGKHPPGNEAMRHFAAQIAGGSRAFLRRQGVALGAFVGVAALLLWPVAGHWVALAFVAGAASTAVAGAAGALTATRANVRAAEAARLGGETRAQRVAFAGGVVPGLAVASLGALALGGMYAVAFLGRGYFLPEEYLAFGEIVSGFALGASAAALLASVGGGIFAKAADMGAGLAGRAAGIAPDDPRNPAAVASHVGDCVGRTAGMGTDLFESYVGAAIAAMVIGAASSPFAESRAQAVALPVLLAALGVVASAAGVALLRLLERQGPAPALRWATLAGTVVFLLPAYFVVVALGFDPGETEAALYRHDGPFWALAAGVGAGIVLGMAAEWYAGGLLARRVAEAAEAGAGTHLIAGLAAGMESAAVPLVILGAAVWAALQAAGAYGIALAAVGILATVGITATVAAYGPVADNASGIARRAHLGREVRDVVERLRHLGDSTAAAGRALAAGSAALAGLALAWAYAAAVGLDRIDLADPRAVVGLLLGGALPFVVAGRVSTAVGRAAVAVSDEAGRQLADTPGLREGTVEPDAVRCVDLPTRAALREMLIPGAAALLAPVLVGVVLGPQALGGMLVGVALAGTTLAFFLAGAGGAWAATRRRLEAAGPESAAAAEVAGAVGDPLRDAAGPAMNILVKLAAVTALVIAPWIARLHGRPNEAPAPEVEMEAMLETARWVVTTLVG